MSFAGAGLLALGCASAPQAFGQRTPQIEQVMRASISPQDQEDLCRTSGLRIPRGGGIALLISSYRVIGTYRYGMQEPECPQESTCRSEQRGFWRTAYDYGVMEMNAETPVVTLQIIGNTLEYAVFRNGSVDQERIRAEQVRQGERYWQSGSQEVGIYVCLLDDGSRAVRALSARDGHSIGRTTRVRSFGPLDQ